MHNVTVFDFDSWRSSARALIAAQIPPEKVIWLGKTEQSLFSDLPLPVPKVSIHISSKLLQMCRAIAVHRDPIKWPLLYRIMWRLAHGEKQILKYATDPDVILLNSLRKDVGRDIHKMKAFVRFKEIADGNVTRYVAWYKPDHAILPLAAPFFKRRFAAMNWTIFTPDASAYWDGTEVVMGEGVVRNNVPEDQVEDLWRTYYASIFNPARVKVKMMKKEMPTRFWHSLPESRLIPQLLRDAQAQVEQMVKKQRGAPAQQLLINDAAESSSLTELAKAASSCERCPLHKHAIQTVFGEGPKSASVVIVGEQPGDEEDNAGKPFVGPAGQILNQALEIAGVARNQLYVTNAVKHFKWTPRGKRRMHQRPSGGEIHACRFWLASELAAIKPKVVVCLGVTAAQSVLGRAVQLKKERGQLIDTAKGYRVLLTFHPSYILRIPDKADKERAFHKLVQDLATLRGFVEQPELVGNNYAQMR